MKKACKELIDFFENEEGWSKEELIADYIGEARKELGFPRDIYADEIVFFWGDEGLPGTLQEFAEKLFDKIMRGVCNVIETQ